MGIIAHILHYTLMMETSRTVQCPSYFLSFFLSRIYLFCLPPVLDEFLVPPPPPPPPPTHTLINRHNKNVQCVAALKYLAACTVLAGCAILVVVKVVRLIFLSRLCWNVILRTVRLFGFLYLSGRK